MIDGKLSTHDFVDEKVLYSQDKDKSVLRLNTWNVNGEKVNTINCARLVSVNHRCSNGMIHMINGVIKPVTKTIADVVTSEPELTTLKSCKGLSELLNWIRTEMD
jgi:transforming growth factor-beta-induced protein